MLIINFNTEKLKNQPLCKKRKDKNKGISGQDFKRTPPLLFLSKNNQAYNMFT